MKIFVAGATGVLGRRALRGFVDAGHMVSGVARSDVKANAVRDLGAEPVLVDLFDADAVAAAVRTHDVVCNFATHIPLSPLSYWRRSAWSTNDRLHRDASRILVDAAIAAGASHYLQHSVAFMYRHGAAQLLDEDAPLDPPPHGDAVLEAESQAHRFAASGGTGVALRFGIFYGPDARSATDLLRIARLGFLPAPGARDAYWPWIHTSDLATSVVAALGAPSGTYNVTDDDPLTRAEYGDVLARALGRKRLRHPPAFAVRLMGKRYDYLRRSLRVSNERFKRATGWTPTVPSSRDGWPSLVRSV